MIAKIASKFMRIQHKGFLKIYDSRDLFFHLYKLLRLASALDYMHEPLSLVLHTGYTPEMILKLVFTMFLS